MRELCYDVRWHHSEDAINHSWQVTYDDPAPPCRSSHCQKKLFDIVCILKLLIVIHICSRSLAALLH